MTRNEIIRGLLELFGPNGERWTKMARARDQQGRRCFSWERKAVSFCLLGGMEKVCNIDTCVNPWLVEDKELEKAIRDVNKKVPCYGGKHNNMSDFMAYNDYIKTKFDDIKNLLEGLLESDGDFEPVLSYPSGQEIIESVYAEDNEKLKGCMPALQER